MDEHNENTPLLRNSFLAQMTDSELEIGSVASADMLMEMASSSGEPPLLDRCDSMPATAQPLHLAMAQDEQRERRLRERRIRAQALNLRRLRPILATPFMPISRQIPSTNPSLALNQRRHRPRSQSPNCNIGTVSAHPRYGSLAHKTSNASSERRQHVTKLNAIPPIHDEQSESEDEQVADQRRALRPQVSSDDSSSSSSSSYTRFSELTSREWATIGMLAIANLCSTVAFSCIAPFYPSEAQGKGLSSSDTGMVFGVFELTMFILSPILGKYMGVIGAKRMFVAGLLLTGISTIAFGFLNFIPSGRIFFWASIVIRCLEAFGDACFVTSSFAISVVTFPGRISTVVGIMETFAGLGFTLGPFIGAILYDYGGFQLPFLFLGALLIIATVASLFLVNEPDEEDEEEEESQGGMIGMLKIPLIWIMIFAVIICAVSLSFFDPTLAGHLQSFNLSTTMVGFVFLLSGGVYTISAPLLGWFVDRFECSNALMVFGSAATIISMIFVGPSPLLNIDKNLVIISISLALFGVAAAALYIPTFQNCLNAVKEKGYEDNFATYGCVSGIFQSAFAFGAFLGPTLGGFSVEKLNFGWTTTIIAFINMLFVLLLTIFFGGRYWLYRRKTNSDGSSSSSESPSRQKPPQV